MANNNGDVWEDVKDVVKDTVDVAQSLGQVISDTWGPGSQANAGLHANDLAAAVNTLGEDFGQLSLDAVNNLVGAPGINAATFNAVPTPGTSAAEMAALGLVVGAGYDAMTAAPDQSGAISAGDQEAGRVSNSAVVSDGDVGQLEAAYSNISGMSAEGQFAKARVGAAIDAARAKLAAAKAAADYNPADSGDYAQQFGSKEAYDAHKQEQLEAMKRAENKSV